MGGPQVCILLSLVLAAHISAPSRALSEYIAIAGLDTEVNNLREDAGVVSSTNNKYFVFILTN